MADGLYEVFGEVSAANGEATRHKPREALSLRTNQSSNALKSSFINLLKLAFSDTKCINDVVETPPSTDPLFDFSMQGFIIARELTKFDKQCEAGELSGTAYEEQLSGFAKQSLEYLFEGLQTFQKDFMLDIEAETFARSLKGKRQQDFALRFNELLYATIGDPSKPVNPISNRAHLQNAIDLTYISDRMNDRNFYQRPNRVREVGDAIIGRAVLTMLSMNEDPRNLRIPVRN